MKEFKKGQAKVQKSAEQIAQEQSTTSTPSTGAMMDATGTYTSLEYEPIDLNAVYQEPFALAIYGAQGSGKTRLGASAPGTVGVVPLNRKTRQTVVDTAKRLQKRIILPKFDLVRSSNPMKSALLKPDCENRVKIDIYRDQPWCCAKHNGRWAADRSKQCAFDHYANPNVDSVFVDGFDILCEDILTAHYGRTERIQPRDRGPYNKELIEFLGALSGKHLVLTMGEKQVWKNEKPTDQFDWAGWTHLGYHVNTVVRATVEENYDADKHDYRWGLDVVLSQANPALMGVAGKALLTDGDISFPGLACRIYPTSEFEDWE